MFIYYHSITGAVFGWFNITCSSMEGCLGKEVQTDLVSYLACYVFVLLVRP